MAPDEQLKEMATALGIGLLIGVVRERKRTDNATVAGVRTHAIIALLGATAWGLGLVPYTIALVIIGGLVIVSHIRSSDPGLTGEMTILFNFILAAMAREHMAIATALGVLCAILLQTKDAIHRFSRDVLSEQEVSDGLLILAASLIVLPLLPNETIDRWSAFNPTTTWKLVILVMATGMLGHVARRTLGARLGLPIAGFFSGFASSTATTAGLGHRAKQDPALTATASASSLLANLASLILMIGILVTVAPALSESLIPSFALAALGLTVVAGFLLIHYKLAREAEGSTSKAFKFSHALAIAVIFSLVSLLAAWLNEAFGSIGAVLTSILVATTEMHSAAAGLGQLAGRESIELSTARWGVLGILASSSISKIVLAFISGGSRYGSYLSLGLTAMVLGAACGLLL